MSTSCRIGIENKDGTISAIRCHADGYVEHTGRRLLQHYTDADKVQRLIALGDISELGERVDPIGPHSWNAKESGTTVAYCRDRGEPLSASQLTTWEDIKYGGTFAYVFFAGSWLWARINHQDWTRMEPEETG
tara:strand:- start:629 stop:1027 length:399 start_codon:yes stop_codon:yes gene_type:complete